MKANLSLFLTCQGKKISLYYVVDTMKLRSKNKVVFREVMFGGNN